jgi:Tfp pilus assembly protein PilN
VIRINLLPADLRRGTRIPARVLAAALGSAIAVSAAVGWFGVVYFGELADAEQALVEATTKLADRTAKASYFDKLETNKKESALRVQTIQDIGKSRRSWSKFMDELIDVVNNNGDTERHLAWFDGMSVKTDPKKGASVAMNCSVQGGDKARLANFHEDLEAAAFTAELEMKSDPTFKLESDPVRIPPLSLRFPLRLEFKPVGGNGKK